jgi:hypothetical protein
MEQQLANLPDWAVTLSVIINILVYSRTVIPSATGTGPLHGVVRVLQTLHDVLAGNFGQAKNER